MRVVQKNSTNTNTVFVCLPHPPNIPNIEQPLLRTASPMIVRYCYSTRINLFRTRKLFGIGQLTRIHNPHVCRMSTTPPARFPPPPDTLSGKHPELAVHPQVNFRSEQRASYPR